MQRTGCKLSSCIFSFRIAPIIGRHSLLFKTVTTKSASVSSNSILIVPPRARLTTGLRLRLRHHDDTNTVTTKSNTSGEICFTNVMLRMNIFRNESVNRRTFRFSYKDYKSYHKPSILSGGLLAFSLFGFWKKEEIDEVNLNINKGRLEAENGNYENADKLYHEGLKVLEQRHQSGDITNNEFVEKRTFIFDCLANLHFKKGDIRTGEAFYKETLKGLFVSGYQEMDNAVIEISVKLANVYAMQKRHAEAVAGYKFCIKAQEDKVNSGDMDENTLALWGLCIDSYARYLVWRDEFKTSKELFEKALELSIKIRGETHEQTLVILNSLATVAVAANNLDNAETYLQQAIKAAESKNYPERAAFYVNLAGVYFQKKQYDKALEYGRHALKVAQLVKDKESQEQALIIIEMMSKRVTQLV